MTLETIPANLETASPGNWTVTPEGIAGTAGPITDLFTDPFGGRRLNSASTLLFPVSGDFLLEAEVRLDFASTFDAGVLLLWQDEDHWAKLCFEFSPQAKPMIVSVVTRDFSDDSNSVVVASNHVRLRIGRRGPACFFHYSSDGRFWNMVRVFRLPDKPLKAGFLVQSPRGDGIRAEFRNVKYRNETLPDIRSGA